MIIYLTAAIKFLTMCSASVYTCIVMKKADAIQFFTRVNEAPHKGVTRLSEHLGITKSLIYMWGENVPNGHAAKLHILTNGVLDCGLKPLPKKDIHALQ